MAEQPKTKALTIEIRVPVECPEPRAILNLLLLPDGNVLAVGPVSDKMICYAILESARDAIKDHHDAMARAAENRIVKPTLQDVGRIVH